jgi:hypothetical protein
VEGDKNIVLKRTPMILNVEDDLKTFSEAISIRNVVF